MIEKLKPKAQCEVTCLTSSLMIVDDKFNPTFMIDHL